MIYGSGSYTTALETMGLTFSVKYQQNSDAYLFNGKTALSQSWDVSNGSQTAFKLKTQS